MVPFESLGMVSYSPSIVTMDVSLAISQNSASKNGVTLKYGFGVVKMHSQQYGDNIQRQITQLIVSRV